MAEWIYEAGIGEARAALVDGDSIIEAHIEPSDLGLRAGSVCEARLTEILAVGRNGTVVCGGREALLEPVPKGLAIGAALLVEITREAIHEPGVVKRAKARVAAEGRVASSGPDLLARITATGLQLNIVLPHAPDALDAAGWVECLEQAASGIVRFEGGTLRISLTPAMTLIDVDGHLPPAALACAAARAAAAAIRRFGIAGSIGIDFPTVANKAERLAATEAFDATLPLPFERTAINGFGFLQIIRPRTRVSLCEQLQHNSVAAAARALLRAAQRSGIIGAATLCAHPAVVSTLASRPEWTDALANALGGTITLRAEPSLAIGAGYATKG